MNFSPPGAYANEPRDERLTLLVDNGTILSLVFECIFLPYLSAGRGDRVFEKLFEKFRGLRGDSFLSIVYRDVVYSWCTTWEVNILQ